MASNSHGSTMSPSDYAAATGLEALLSKAANDCYLAQSACPAAAMSQLLRATYTIDSFSDIVLREVCDGDVGGGGGFSAEVSAHIASGPSGTTTVSHSNSTVPFHPSSGTTGRRIALIPREVLVATGPGSLQSVLCPPPIPTPAPAAAAAKKGASAAAQGDEKGGAAGSNGGGAAAAGGASQTFGEVDPTALVTGAALAKATRFRLNSAISFFNHNVRPTLLPLRAGAQHEIDAALLASDPNGPFEHLLGQVAAAVSLSCAKAAAAAFNKPLALHVGALYQGICSRDGAMGMGAGGGNSNSIAPINLSLYSVPDLVVTVFSTDPRGMGRVRVREVCLVVKTQGALAAAQRLRLLQHRDGAPAAVYGSGIGGSGMGLGGSTAHHQHQQQNTLASPAVAAAPLPSGQLTMDTIGKLYAIIEVATAKAAAIAAAQCGIASTASVESAMMPVMPDGSVRFPFWESTHQIVSLMESAILEVVGGSSSSSSSSAPNSSNPFSVFSVGLVMDGALCYRPQTDRYALVGGEPDVTGATLSEHLAALVGGAASSGSSSSASGAATAAAATSAATAAASAGGSAGAGGSAPPSSSSTALPPSAVGPNGTVIPNGVVTYLEDTHAASDILAMQRLMYRVGGGGGTPLSSGGQTAAGASVGAGSGSGYDYNTLNGGVIIAGAHLYGSDATALSQGARLGLTNNATFRLNDVGRLTTLLENAALFRNSRAGGSVGLIGEASEGDGAALAHVAVGMHCRTLRVGGLQRREHAAVVNELMRLSELLARRGLLSRSPTFYDHSRMAMPPRPADLVAEVVAAPVKKGRK